MALHLLYLVKELSGDFVYVSFFLGLSGFCFERISFRVFGDALIFAVDGETIVYKKYFFHYGSLQIHT